jgi:hypothetical protein
LRDEHFELGFGDDRERHGTELPPHTRHRSGPGCARPPITSSRRTVVSRRARVIRGRAGRR